MEFIKIQDNKKMMKDINELYKEAFPKEERAPMFILKRTSKKPNADLFGIYDESIFVGMTYTIYNEDIVYVFYLAISEKLRGQGYGSKVLDELKLSYKGKRIALGIEVITEDCPNYEQRVTRKKFYLRNGLEECNIITKEYGVVTELLSYNGKVTLQEYDSLLMSFTGKIIYKWYMKRSDINNV